jgi:hypothetical protein
VNDIAASDFGGFDIRFGRELTVGVCRFYEHAQKCPLKRDANVRNGTASMNFFVVAVQ